MNNKWYPIEIAPQDGSWILVYNPENDEIHKVKWMNVHIPYEGAKMAWAICESYDSEWATYSTVENPSHWMRLPDKPE